MALLYQSGYLTIKSYDPQFETVRLDYPNREVTEGFLDQLLEIFINSQTIDSGFGIGRFVNDVKEGE